jgi:vesicle coat complex subunit
MRIKEFILYGLKIQKINIITCMYTFNRLASLVEYTKDAVLKGLKDHSSYVRKAAVMGCLQLYKLAPQQLNGKHIL